MEIHFLRLSAVRTQHLHIHAGSLGKALCQYPFLSEESGGGICVKASVKGVLYFNNLKIPL